MMCSHQVDCCRKYLATILWCACSNVFKDSRCNTSGLHKGYEHLQSFRNTTVLKLVLSSPYFTCFNRIVGATHWYTCAFLLPQNTTVMFSLLVIRQTYSAVATNALGMTTAVYQFRDVGGRSGIAWGTAEDLLDNRTCWAFSKINGSSSKAK